jgi:hypothetical protein
MCSCNGSLVITLQPKAKQRLQQLPFCFTFYQKKITKAAHFSKTHHHTLFHNPILSVINASPFIGSRVWHILFITCRKLKVGDWDNIQHSLSCFIKTGQLVQSEKRRDKQNDSMVMLYMYFLWKNNIYYRMQHSASWSTSKCCYNITISWWSLTSSHCNLTLSPFPLQIWAMRKKIKTRNWQSYACPKEPHCEWI